MSPSMLKIVTFIIVALVVIIVLVVTLKDKKIKKYKRCIAFLDREKNNLESAPILGELNKIETIAKNDKMEEKFKEWQDTYEWIKNEDISRLNDDIINLDLLLDKKDYNSFLFEYSKSELYLYKVRNKVEHLLKDIEDINESEEKYRDIVTRLKTKYRELNSTFEIHKESYTGVESIIELQFENIEKRFQDFEELMENNDYSEVVHIVKAIDTMIDHMSVVIEEIPDLVLLATKLIPKRIEQISETYSKMKEENYPLDYLKIEYNVEESLKKVNEINDRIKVLNLVDCMFELRTMLEYLDSIFNEFEKEKVARKEYEDAKGSFDVKLSKTVTEVKEIYKQIEDIKNMYDLTDRDVAIIDDVNTRLNNLKKEYNKDLRKLSSSKTPYSKISQDLNKYTVELQQISDDLDGSLKSLGNMYDDEVRAREQLDEIQDLLHKSKLHIKDNNIPLINDNYFVELNEANDAILEIIKELENKPIAIKILNTRVDTARDLVLKLYNTTNMMVRNSAACESLLVYGNKFRSTNIKLNRELTEAEKLYFKGNYEKALKCAITAIENVDKNIKEKVGNIYVD